MSTHFLFAGFGRADGSFFARADREVVMDFCSAISALRMTTTAKPGDIHRGKQLA
jgi:NADH:ubiquinone oxidoreductase subunit D